MLKNDNLHCYLLITKLNLYCTCQFNIIRVFLLQFIRLIISFRHDGNFYLYSRDMIIMVYFRKVIIWKELNEWTKIYEHTVHDSSVNSIAWAPHELGLVLACGSSDGSISCLINNGDNWETQKIPNAHTIGCNAVSWCPVTEPVFDNASQQQKAPVKRLASAGCDNIVKIWKEEGDKWIEETKLEAHSDWASFLLTYSQNKMFVKLLLQD